MKRAQRLMGGRDSGLLWLACLIALGGGYYIAFVLLGSAIDSQHRLTDRVSGALASNAMILGQRPALEAAERSAEARLRGLDFGADKTTTVARFIGALTRTAAAQRVNLDRVDQRGAAGEPAPAAISPDRPGSGSHFDVIPLDVTLSGTYPELLTAIRELAQAPLAMQIDIAAIERTTTTTAAGSTDAPLTARLHVSLQRRNDDPAGLLPATSYR